MASTYGYITVANLEAYESIDYGTINSTAYSDANVEAKISIAERVVNGIIGTTYTGTIPDRIVSATTIIAAQLMRNVLIRNGDIDPDNPDSQADIERKGLEGTLLENLLAPEQADNLDMPGVWVKKH